MNALAGPLYVVTGVLLVAGIAKIVRPSATATALRELHIPAPLRSAQLLGVAELVLAITAVATGHPLLWAGVAVSYSAFTVFILWALRGNGAIGSCGCFGREDTPPTPGHAAFNAAAATLAALAVADPLKISQFDGSNLQALLLIMLVSLGVLLVVAALTTLPRLLALANGTAPPVVPTFSTSGGRGI